MKSVEVLRRQQRLDSLFKKITVLSGDIELQSQWARYLCVLVSGFLEASLRIVISEYARKRATDDVGNYVESQLSEFRNPNMERILKLVRSFNPAWADELEATVEGEIKDAVDSIVSNRNIIAHGDDVGISFSRISDYYKRAVKVIDWLNDKTSQ